MSLSLSRHIVIVPVLQTHQSETAEKVQFACHRKTKVPLQTKRQTLFCARDSHAAPPHVRHVGSQTTNRDERWYVLTYCYPSSRRAQLPSVREGAANRVKPACACEGVGSNSSCFLLPKQVYHSAFTGEGYPKACGCALLPLRASTRGPAQITEGAMILPRTHSIPSHATTGTRAHQLFFFVGKV